MANSNAPVAIMGLTSTIIGNRVNRPMISKPIIDLIAYNLHIKLLCYRIFLSVADFSVVVVLHFSLLVVFLYTVRYHAQSKRLCQIIEMGFRHGMGRDSLPR